SLSCEDLPKLAACRSQFRSLSMQQHSSAFSTIRLSIGLGRAAPGWYTLVHAPQAHSSFRSVQPGRELPIRRRAEQGLFLCLPIRCGPSHAEDVPLGSSVAHACQRMLRAAFDFLVREFPEQRPFAGLPDFIVWIAESNDQFDALVAHISDRSLDHPRNVAR